jgi:hypothetical protein
VLITNWRIEDVPMLGGQGPYRVMTKKIVIRYFLEVPIVARTYTDGQFWTPTFSVFQYHIEV